MVAQLDFLRDVRGVIVGGVGNLARTIENKLTGNGERNDKQEQVLETQYTNVQKIMQELGLSREASMKTNKELVAMGKN